MASMTIINPEGTELRDIDEALRVARALARSMLPSLAVTNTPVTDIESEVRDEGGVTVATVPLSELLD